VCRAALVVVAAWVAIMLVGAVTAEVVSVCLVCLLLQGGRGVGVVWMRVALVGVFSAFCLHGCQASVKSPTAPMVFNQCANMTVFWVLTHFIAHPNPPAFVIEGDRPTDRLVLSFSPAGCMRFTHGMDGCTE